MASWFIVVASWGFGYIGVTQFWPPSSLGCFWNVLVVVSGMLPDRGKPPRFCVSRLQCLS